MKPGDLRVVIASNYRLIAAYTIPVWDGKKLWFGLPSGSPRFRAFDEDDLFLVLDAFQHDQTVMSSTAIQCLTQYGPMWFRWYDLSTNTRQL